ncbi:MAG: MopE-related protein [Candidatus Calescibacterium sp.]|nr:MopE-related protein [Candidatus Calescibacterium sp.]
MKTGSLIFLSIAVLFLSACQEGAKNGNQIDKEKGKDWVEITGSVSAELGFVQEQGIVTARIVTGRIVTGRIVTARSPLFKKDEKQKVAGALVAVEEQGVSTESDTEGNFSLPVSVSGCPCKFTLSVGAVRKDGKSYKVRQVIEITQEDIKNKKKDVGEIMIYATGGIYGKVKLKGSDSAQGVYVYVPGTPMVTITDEDGNFIMGDIPIGTYDFVIEKYGYESDITRGVQIESGTIVFIGEFELERVEQKFRSGKVVDQNDEPVAGALIVSDTGKSAISDRYGNFQISDDSKTITVWKEGYQMEIATVEGQEIKVRLLQNNLKLGAIKGKVYNWVTTKPVGGVTVILLPSGNATVTTNDGSFTLSDVLPGSYTLMFIRSDYEIGIEIASVRNGQVVDLGILGLFPECILTKFYRDGDGDGFGDGQNYVEDCYAPYGYVGNTNDCNDSDVSVHPGAVEICNGKDDNCNGDIDEFVYLVFYRDSDSDGYGNPNSTTQACSKPNGYVMNNLDCNDSNSMIKPTSIEICDTLDQDCDGFVNDGILSYFYKDGDGDGQGSSSGITSACRDLSNKLRDINGLELSGAWSENSLDCNDANSSVRFGINEVNCDGVDENCNGILDDGVLITFYRDSDSDGYGNPNSTTQACSAPAGFVSNRGDCDDGNPKFNPSITEIVDGGDENCDGVIDNLIFDWETISSLSPVHYVDSSIDVNGDLHVAFNYTAYGGPMWLGYYRKTVNVWYSQTHYLGSGNIYNCSIDVFSNGATAYFSYSVTSGGTCASYGVCVISYSNQSNQWESPKNLNSHGRFSSLDIVENVSYFGGSATHVVYSTGISIVHTYAVPLTPNFSLSSAIISPMSVTDIDMVVSPNGATVHIIFAGLDGGIYYPYYTRNLTPYNFGAWLVPIRITTYTYNVKSVGIALFSDGTTHVCFAGENATNLFYAKAKNSSFDPIQGVDSAVPISSCSITVDNLGNPHIAYYSKPFGEIRYATLWSGQWKKYTVALVNLFPQNRGVNILVDSKRVPHIVFIWNGFAAYATLSQD